jgi:hypothetical protein
VLSGEKQRTSRGYDFAKVSRWFAERSDLILLLFDCSKLDISDEFKVCLAVLYIIFVCLFAFLFVLTPHPHPPYTN